MANLDVYEYCKRFVVDHNFFGRSTILRDMISNIVLISTQALKPEAPTFEVLVVNKNKFKENIWWRSLVFCNKASGTAGCSLR